MEGVKLRRLNDDDSDYKLLENWYQKKEIYTHFEQRKLNYEEIKNKYYPRTLQDTKIPVYMIEYNNKPIGIIQYQKVNKDNLKLYNLKDNNCYELDIFIGNLEFHNKGIGSNAINILSQKLFSNYNAKYLIMCPLKDNIQGIRCYQKCGFIIKNKFESKDTIGNIKEYILMIKERN